MAAVTGSDHPTTDDLKDIQGGIIGFNKDLQRLVHVDFVNAEAGRGFMRHAATFVASGREVLDFNALYKHVAGRGERPCHGVKAAWVNLWLSDAGLALVQASGLDAFPPEFVAGMAARAGQIGDVGPSEPGAWVAPFAGGAVPHAIVVIAADESDDLDAAYQDIRTAMASSGVQELGSAQDGEMLPGGREHFGFRDGVSQPGIRGLTKPSKAPNDVVAAGEFLIGYRDEQGNLSGQPPHTPPPPPSPYTPSPPPPVVKPLPDWARNGSFVVYRRLRQDVAAFRAVTPPDGVTPEQLQAKLVGRWPSGAPMEHVPGLPHNVDPSSADASTVDPHVLDDDHINNFDYASDAAGLNVPRAAHIRKANPRSSQLPEGDASNRHRLLRRGIPYGPAFVEGEQPYGGTVPPEQDRGLLFVCYQASIADGFEFVQQNWANAPDFQQSGDGEDPIISQNQDRRPFRLPRPQGAVALNFAQWVVTTGGGYFFSPSLSALGILGGTAQTT